MISLPLSEMNSTSCPTLFAPSAKCSASMLLFEPGRRLVEMTTTFFSSIRVYISYIRVVMRVAVTVGIDGRPVVRHLEQFPIRMVAGEHHEGHHPEHGYRNPQRP